MGQIVFNSYAIQREILREERQAFYTIREKHCFVKNAPLALNRFYSLLAEAEVVYEFAGLKKLQEFVNENFRYNRKILIQMIKEKKISRFLLSKKKEEKPKTIIRRKIK